MQKNTAILSIILALVLGVVIGNAFDGSYKYAGKDKDRNGSHHMQDGSVMDNDDLSMEDMMDHMNEMLKGKTGDEFDRAFLAEMIVHHQGAIDMAELSAANAKHQEIKDLSAAIITAQEKEIADMKAWQKAWYGAE
jgi:uncharacterized protein (DUF305 family)